MAKRQPSKLVVGAWVRIVIPAFFVRCGYPMTPRTEAQRIERDHRPQIDQFLKSVGVNPFEFPPHSTPKVVHEAARAAAYELCRQKRFGGPERTIHAREIPSAAGAEFEVVGVRFVKTGTYCRGGISSGYYGDGEPEPNYLSDEKMHRILKTGMTVMHFGTEWDHGDSFGLDLEIEACNVELVREATADGRMRLGAKG